MRKTLIVLIAGIILLNALGTIVSAQDEECDEDEDCLECRNNNFYYVLMAGLIVFAFFFYIRNRNKIG